MLIIRALPMNPLAFNFEIPQRLRTKQNIALAVLPLGLMFASFAPLWFFATWLGTALGIPPGVPVKDQPNGYLWFVIFLIMMLLFMFGGYLLGWGLNALAMRVFFKWPQEKIRRVFLYSEAPPSWLKDSNPSPNGFKSPPASKSAWAITRQKGKLHFVLYRGVLAWGTPMYVIMAGIPAMIGKVELTPSYFFWQACLWGIGGALFGLMIWHFSEKSFLKRNGTKEP
jgi:hypothetical protein